MIPAAQHGPDHTSPVLCPLHGAPLVTCCLDCSVPLCASCEGHDKHKIESIDELITEHIQAEASEPFQHFIIAAQGHVATLEVSLQQLKAEEKMLRDELAGLDSQITAAEQSFEADMCLVDEALAVLNALAGRACSDVLRDAFDGAKVHFDVEDEIRGSFLGLRQRRADLALHARRMRTDVQAAEVRLGLVLAAAGLAAPHTRLRAIARLCDLAAAPGARVSNYVAFSKALELPSVLEALAAPTKDVGGVSVSERPVEVTGAPSGECVEGVASLSSDGTLCVTNREYGRSSLCVYNLLSRRRALLDAPNVYWACVFRGDLFVGITRATHVLFASLGAALEGLPLARFARFEVPGAITSAALDRAGDGWVVFQDGLCFDRLVRVDLARRRAVAVTCDKKLRSIGPLSGIRAPGALCVALEWGGRWATLVVREDGSTEEVSRGLSNFPLLLPSAADASSFADAAVLDFSARFMYKGNMRDFACAVKPAARQTLVRVYRDVFLCLDSVSWKWHALRICVP
eukprot:gnl/Chilomastix_cuspidata/6448.p1 GENE.gnl/Chilomastix_cuspidata/6448~~gnl/Chilomastix_cuspidata/6448.p1  ORF type:complete len:527 (-),score=204.03 gnl/Chilomastix_cuspidata/6448:190-1740(-)